MTDDGATNREAEAFFHFDSIGPARQKLVIRRIIRSQPFAIVKGKGHIAVVIGEDITFTPLVRAQQLVDVEEALTIDIEGNPVPSLVEIDGLHILAATTEDERGFHCAHDRGALEEDLFSGIEEHLVTSGTVPESEIHLLFGLRILFIVVDVDIDQVLILAIADVGHSVTHIIVVEHAHDVI